MAASPTERSWCVLEFALCNSFVAVQRAFRRQFGRCGPLETSIRKWYEQFRYRGCICRQVLQNTPIIYTHPILIYYITLVLSSLYVSIAFCGHLQRVVLRKNILQGQQNKCTNTKENQTKIKKLYLYIGLVVSLI
jgi:hypothetical protein